MRWVLTPQTEVRSSSSGVLPVGVLLTLTHITELVSDDTLVRSAWWQELSICERAWGRLSCGTVLVPWVGSPSCVYTQ